IDGPGIYLRDLTAPAVAITELSDGWFGSAPRALLVRWNASDNFGGDGMGAHEITVGGQRVWAGSPGAGAHSVSTTVPSGLRDGVHSVAVTVHGDGTAAGTAAGSIRVDRTAPTGSTGAPSHPGTPRAVSVSWTTADATSGVASSQTELLSGD